MHDALVVGLGAMGSAALYHLSARGGRVVGVDRFAPPHTLGSTHGRSRIIREAYFEHPSYVPLVRKAYANWAALEDRSGSKLFQKTGGLMMGAPESGLVRGSLESARLHDIDVETLSADAIMSRFPALVAEQGMIGVLERNAGMLFPEACVRAHLDLARALGAEVCTGTTVTGLSRSGGAVTAETTDGPIRARRLILAAGPWTSGLLEMLGASIPLVVERQTMHWFEPVRDRELLLPKRLPVTLIEHGAGRIFYFMPNVGDGVKAAIHYEGEYTTAEAIDREIRASDVDPAKALLARFLPAAAGAVRESAVCLYTNTPDLDFVIDTVEGMPNVILASACSGHGFKFASAVGEIVAQLAVGEQPAVDISHFRAARFA